MSATVDLDLLSLVRQYTRVPDKQSATTNGGEYKAACPLPGCGSRADALCIWPKHAGGARWWCRACDKSGDAIAFLVGMGDLDNLGAAWARSPFELTEGGEVVADPASWLVVHNHWSPRAAAILGAGASCAGAQLAGDRRPAPPPPAPTVAPGQDWQAAGRAFVATCRAALWTETGARALAWLRGRGLVDDTIRAAALGYNPAEGWGSWGERRVKLPRGVVIPWEVGGDLWRVNVRRPAGDPKYYSPAGCKNGLYNAGSLATVKPALLVEGELDALTVAQVAGDLITPVATGSTTGSRRPRWIAALAACPLVLVAFDADQAGTDAAAWWVGVLPNGQRWRPAWGDANQMLQEGADLRGWLLAALGGPESDATSEPRATGADLGPGRPTAAVGAGDTVRDWLTTNGGSANSCKTDIRVKIAPEPWAAELPCRIEDWPEFCARWGLGGLRLVLPEGPGRVGLVAENDGK